MTMRPSQLTPVASVRYRQWLMSTPLVARTLHTVLIPPGEVQTHASAPTALVLGPSPTTTRPSPDTPFAWFPPSPIWPLARVHSNASQPPEYARLPTTTAPSPDTA